VISIIIGQLAGVGTSILLRYSRDTYRWGESRDEALERE
jgi:hypothetical protein